MELIIGIVTSFAAGWLLRDSQRAFYEEQKEQQARRNPRHSDPPAEPQKAPDNCPFCRSEVDGRAGCSAHVPKGTHATYECGTWIFTLHNDNRVGQSKVCTRIEALEKPASKGDQ